MIAQVCVYGGSQLGEALPFCTWEAPPMYQCHGLFSTLHMPCQLRQSTIQSWSLGFTSSWALEFCADLGYVIGWDGSGTALVPQREIIPGTPGPITSSLTIQEPDSTLSHRTICVKFSCGPAARHCW